MYQALKDLIERLVDHFSDPYAFLRELVQNSLDAGSAQVEFELEYSQHTTILTCHDTGEGMDEQGIDTRLTRIFASSKEDDLTKIGQFGIGFLSVFALKPDHVVIDTGRNGQAWRVHFTHDHSFLKTALSEPMDGTRIRWVKQQKPAAHREFERKCRKALEHWCRHAQALISWNGKPINQSLPWTGHLTVQTQGPGTEVSIRPGSGWLGLYNQGLTLSEGREDLWPGVDVKINSRYLTHTLTRDRVVRDQNFEKARQVVESAIEQLIPLLIDNQDLRSLSPLLARLTPEQRSQPLLSGLSLNQLAGHKQYLYTEKEDTLSQRLRDQGRVVLTPTRGMDVLLKALEPSASLMEIHNVYMLPELVKPTQHQQLWLHRIIQALTRLGEFYQSAWLAELPGQIPILSCHQPREPVLLNFQPEPGEARQLLVNCHHPLWSGLWDLEEDWGVPALCQPLWTAFPHLFPNEAARQRFALGA